MLLHFKIASKLEDWQNRLPMTETKEIGSLEKALDYEFKNMELIIEALTHRSHHHEHGDSLHNERLEFLGDAVLDLCVTEIVMELSPTTNEGHLSKLRSQLVSESSLARAARRLDLGAYVRLGKGEDLSGGRDRDALLADALEAVIAAMYLDGGLQPLRKIIPRILDVNSSDTVTWATTSWNLITRDYKSRLQEYCQSAGLGAPTYQCKETSGPDHQKSFTMGLVIQNIEVIRADGLTKKEATQKAAQALLAEAQDCETGLMSFLQNMGVKIRKSSLPIHQSAVPLAPLSQKPNEEATSAATPSSNPETSSSSESSL